MYYQCFSQYQGKGSEASYFGEIFFVISWKREEKFWNKIEISEKLHDFKEIWLAEGTYKQPQLYRMKEPWLHSYKPTNLSLKSLRLHNSCNILFH